MSETQEYSLLLFALAALLLPGLARFLRMPAVVAEILFGVLVGRSLLNMDFSGEWLPFLADLGFLLLMFQAGMEIDFGALRKQSRDQILFHGLFFAATFATALACALFLGRGMFMTLVLTTTSLGLVMPTLKETGLSRTSVGQFILIAATLADFLTLFGITFYILFIQYGISWRFVLPVPLFLGFGLLLRLGRLWAWWYPSQAARVLGLTSDTQEIGVRLAMALLFLFVGLSELVHLEPVLGAFLGGALLSFVFREKAQLENKLSAFGFGFVIPFFFIHVGMQFDMAGLFTADRLTFTLLLLAAAMLVKLLPAGLLILRGERPAGAFRVGILLTARLSLIVAAASLGLENGLITPEIKDSVVLLAIVTCFVGPTVFRLTLRDGDHRQENGRKQNARETQSL